MSLITMSIDLMKSFVKPKKMDAHEVSSILESIHNSLMEMNQKETTLLSDQMPNAQTLPIVKQKETTEPIQQIATFDHPASHSEPSVKVISSQKNIPEKTQIVDTSSPESVSIDNPNSIPTNSTGVTDDSITCLICGKSMKRLFLHLKTDHNLTPETYRSQFNLPKSMPLISQSLSKRQSEINRQRNSASNLNKTRKETNKDASTVNISGSIPGESALKPTILAHADDTITCLICGQAKKRLHPHLKTDHGIDAETYRRRFNLSPSQPLIAPSITRKVGEKSRMRHAAARLVKNNISTIA